MRLPIRSKDFRRIEKIERRNPDEMSHRVHQDEVMTDILKRSLGKMDLWPTQSFALYEAADNQGLLGSIGVGHGKTLISLLSATVIELKATTPYPINTRCSKTTRPILLSLTSATSWRTGALQELVEC